MKYTSIFLTLLALMLSACKGVEEPPPVTDQPTPSVDRREPHVRLLDMLRANTEVLPPRLQRVELFSMYNREAPIPPQCYTKTEGTHNPCYVCHQDAIPGRENQMNDFSLQEAYKLSEIGATNHWKNLFEDRSQRVAAISDDAILQWINQDNYSELAGRLKQADFQGWIPDLKDLQLGAAAFDEEGFAKDGSQWVSFNYKPLPSTFWPTNGSTDDVMIRLPQEFRTNAKGDYSRDVYKANLAIVEANIKGLKKIGSLLLDERNVGEDLNGDRRLTRIDTVTKVAHFVGAAKDKKMEPYIFPLGTEFLHTVRYVGIAKNGDIYNAPRMKEVRYMQRWLEGDVAQMKHWYDIENAEKGKGELPAYVNLGHQGLGSPMGWKLSGFIEDSKGRLRFNSFEENMFCMGCHNSIGSTIDKTFSFARKVNGAKGWGYINLKGMPDAPNMGEKKGEIATYLERVGGGSEFRSNPEMQARWYNPDGSVNQQAVANAKDVYDLIAPSPARALQLNKAYKVIVEDQTFIFGRDATVMPPTNVYAQVDTEKAPTLPPERQYKWDIRLDWPQGLTK
ncbi:MAG TPA: hypothetical protein VFM46_19945 [Pseudomonadales bacterium]|nr:hypothetical protein [Pseudomonadales bacterium]